MAIGWLANLAEAESYFSGERLNSTYWDALVSTTGGGKDEKTAVLTMAYNRIRRSKDFTIPASPTSDQTSVLQMAQCEMAYYLAQHLAGEDSRKGLQAQGVTAAGIVKESYSESNLATLAIPAAVQDILDSFSVGETPFFAIDIDRDEDEEVTHDPVDL